jgi:hypothetical protein
MRKLFATLAIAAGLALPVAAAAPAVTGVSATHYWGARPATHYWG